MFYKILFALILSGATAPALAQSLFQDPVGLTIGVAENTLIFDAPPGGLSNQAQPQGILSTQSQRLSIYPLTKTESGGYSVDQPEALVGDTLTVTGYRDVLQGNQTVRWLQVAPTDSSGQIGWISTLNSATSLRVQQ